MVIVHLVAVLVAAFWLLVPALPPFSIDLGLFAAFSAGAVLTIAAYLSRWSTATGAAVARHRRLVLRVTAALVVVLVALAITYSVTGPDPWPAGQPTMINGHYFLDVHGSLKPITAAEYRVDLRASVQSLIIAAAALDVAALAALTRTGRRPVLRSGAAA